ncbi:UPF0481 protein At3g47200-like [Alnus glutinosa]|uniref:UPF0481 protein At3g47200-like n=1 Tax=Alnus glutinosa TaxID=3517 RepID=UPI002D78702A|nr:UPF0481 protein At3g47200-like [Alnus glutinosa]XP_062152644.1 UPF0481 protein At3g47200-like [Alnus glutinosa]XP_062152666.1 UPF0481 protein At3g47200-like [Alnus glutinosa]XP_062152667.1 UPF0481 protein At3g47200-like [Alnus glutinosa]
MAVNEGDSIRIDIDRLVSSIEDMVSHDLIMPAKCCIFKTPAILYRHNEKAFIPDAFSIGPLHHGRPNLKATENIKAKYLQGLISRSYSPHTILRTLIISITEVEKDARECYAEAIDYNPEEFVKILVIDGCFLIELFRKKAYLVAREEDDPIFTQSCMIQFLNHDLILLENQVPWMVLEILFNLTKHSNRDFIPLSLLAVNFLSITLLSYGMQPQLMQTNMNIQGIEHIVDLDRKLSTLSIEDKEERIGGWELLPSATSLVEAGIKFKRGTSSENILDIKFIDGVLEIPPLVIHDVTETAFRNLISYEQCYPKCEAKITSYAVLLDSLINTAKDMDILCENKIIENWLNPEDAAQLFNKLYLDTYVDYCYTDLCRQVNSFCQRRWPRWRGALVRNYFNTPWAILSTLAAVILLILTMVQTWYSITS